jgi:hypothetical protein
MTRPVLVGPWPSVPGHDRPALAEIFNSLAGLYLWAPRRMDERRASVLAKDIHSIDGPEPTLMWERGSYRLSSLLILRPLADSDGKGTIRHFAILAETRRYQADGGSTHHVLDGPPTEYTLQTTQRNAMNEQVRIVWLKLTDEYWSRLDESFEARPGQVNEWTIPLPDELIKAVRQKLAAKK